MIMRDPKQHPTAGDVLTKFGSTRTVDAVETNGNGTITHVHYSGLRITISAWRSWSRDECKVLEAA